MWKIGLISTCLISYTSPILLLHNYYWKNYKLSSVAGNKKVEAAFFFQIGLTNKIQTWEKPHYTDLTAQQQLCNGNCGQNMFYGCGINGQLCWPCFMVMFPQLKDCASLSFWEIRIQKHAVKWKVLKMWMASEKRAICLSLSATQMNSWTPGSYDFRWPDKLRNAEMKTSYGISNGKHFYEAWMKNWFCEEWFISHIWTFFDHLIVWAINWQFKLLLL